MTAATNDILKITHRVPGITRALLLYRLVQLVTFPLIFCYFVMRLVTQRDYLSHFGERLGFLPRLFTRTKAGSIWLHAVSVGEIASAIPLIKKLRHEFAGAAIYLSTSTVAGRKTAEQEAGQLVSGVFYLPLDYVSLVRRVLRVIRPTLVVVLETEIWPNLYAEVKRSGASLAIVNGRISDRAWPRYLAWNKVFAPVVQLADVVLVQGASDRDRYAQLGVAPERLEIEANLKYDAACARGVTDITTFGADHVWIAASTVGPNERGSVARHSIDEDDIVVDAFQALAKEFPRLLLILAPRQRRRFDEVARKLDRAAIRFIRRTDRAREASPIVELPGVLLLDTIGDLARAYTLADVVFVGGSLAPRGGHNIVEPSAAGAPVVIGPNMQNFETIVRDFLAADAVVQIQCAEELAPAVRKLLLDRECAANLGERARDLVTRRQGVAGRIVEKLGPLYYRGHFKSPRNLLYRSVLAALAWVWREGGFIKRRRSERYAASVLPLPIPVISIGGITLGGSGKTPFATYLAARLNARGYSPAILTRGYRRRSPAKSLVFAPGVKVPPAFTGDEAQIFLRDGIAPIGIGAKRYETAQVLLAQFPSTDVLLLDDGFQHARLKRDLDIVLIDGLDPVGQEGIVPLGRLREPLCALERADALVVTRAESDGRYEAIKTQMREYNPHAPIFRTRLLARRWRDCATGECMSKLPAIRVAAFCGLGNPQNFWHTLESLGLTVVFRWAFGDHHTYQPVELQRLVHQASAHGAEIIVTTEKDRMNCPAKIDGLIAPLKLAWLEIELELDEEANFLAFVESKLRSRSAA
jgi:3-deoxy-D-manno-octulosonic-acid transferase